MQAAVSQIATDQDTPEDELRRGVSTRMDPQAREKAAFERLISSMEPSLKGDPSRLDIYIQGFKREFVNDEKLFATEIKAEPVANGAIHLSGHVMFSEHKDALLKLFKYLGFENVQDDVEVLPSARLGKNKFGLIVAAHDYSYSGPDGRRERLTDSFIGDGVFLLAPADNLHYLIANGEGYIGYMSMDAILPVDEARFAAYQEGTRAIFGQDFHDGDLFIPAGARLKALEEKGDSVVLQLPDGSTTLVPENILILRSSKPSPKVLEAYDVAKSKLGTVYLWGGKTSEGVDCSGLIRSSWQAQGINLPRDAYMQAYVGNLVATRWYWDDLRMGDLMFFLGGNGKIHHVAMAIGNGDYIESSGHVKYASINPASATYDEKRAKTFCFAKRLIE